MRTMSTKIYVAFALHLVFVAAAVESIYYYYYY